MSDAPTQLPPADELAAVREQLKALKAREDDLRALMLSDPSARMGNNFAAQIREITERRPDIAALKQAYPEAYEAVTFPRKVTRVELVGVSEDGEVISARRKQLQGVQQ